MINISNFFMYYMAKYALYITSIAIAPMVYSTPSTDSYHVYALTSISIDSYMVFDFSIFSDLDDFRAQSV
jgi:hypothetical protein